MSKGKIIRFGSSDICLFCGNPKKTKYEEYEVYFECDCPDAVKKREIEEQIRKLKLQIPKENFEIKEEQVLYKKRDSNITFGGGVSDGFEEGSLNDVK